MNDDRVTTTDRLRKRQRELKLDARLKEVEYKAILSKEFQRGVQSAIQVLQHMQLTSIEDDKHDPDSVRCGFELARQIALGTIKGLK